MSAPIVSFGRQVNTSRTNETCAVTNSLLDACVWAKMLMLKIKVRKDYTLEKENKRALIWKQSFPHSNTHTRTHTQTHKAQRAPVISRDGAKKRAGWHRSVNALPVSAIVLAKHNRWALFYILHYFTLSFLFAQSVDIFRHCFPFWLRFSTVSPAYGRSTL